MLFCSVELCLVGWVMNIVGSVVEYGLVLQVGKLVIDFIGCCVFIVGGSKGIGCEMVLVFVGVGVQVLVCVCGQVGLEVLCVDVQVQGVLVYVFFVDLVDFGQIQVWLQVVVDVFGGIDVLVNNVIGYGMVDNEEGWVVSLQIDLMVVVCVLCLVLFWLCVFGDVCIFNLLLIVVQQLCFGGVLYVVVKVVFLYYIILQVLVLVKDWIWVNVIVLGLIEFDDGLWDCCCIEDFVLYYGILVKILFGCFGYLCEIVDVVLFLCLLLVCWVIGSVFNVDGGQVLMG